MIRLCVITILKFTESVSECPRSHEQARAFSIHLELFLIGDQKCVPSRNLWNVFGCTGFSRKCWLSFRNFFRGGIYCYANFSIAFGPDFRGKSPRGKLPPGWGGPVEESQNVQFENVSFPCRTLEAARCSQFTDTGFLALTRVSHYAYLMSLYIFTRIPYVPVSSLFCFSPFLLQLSRISILDFIFIRALVAR